MTDGRRMPARPGSFSLIRLRGFLALAQYLNFRRAAQALGVSQPALSGQIKGLEKSLGVSLFSRTTRRVALSADGQRFVLRAQRLIEAFDHAVGEMTDDQKLHRGTVVFSCIPTIAAAVFPKIIRDFVANHPGVRVEMRDDSTAAMERRILNHEVEFGIGGSPRLSTELEFTPIVDDPFVLVCRPDHPLARQKSVRLSQLLNEPIISLRDTSNVGQTLSYHFARNGRTFSPAQQVIHHYTVGAMVEAGLGVTLLPSMACRMIRGARLKMVPLSDKQFCRSVGLIRRSGDRLSSAANRFYLQAAEAMNATTKLNGRASRKGERA